MRKIILATIFSILSLSVIAQGSGKNPIPNMPQSAQDAMDMLNQMMGGSSIKIEEQDLSDVQPSKFIGSLAMTFETTQNGKPIKSESGDMEFHIDKFKLALITQAAAEGEIRMIMDRENGYMTMLTIDKKGKKSGIKMKLPKITIEGDASDDTDNNTKVTITNEKKKIENYDCTKVIIEDEDNYTEAWVTDEKDISLIEIFNYINISNQKKESSKHDAYSQLSGLAMEATTRNKKSGETTLVQVKKVVKGTVDAKMFSTDGYQIMDMTQMKMGW